MEIVVLIVLTILVLSLVGLFTVLRGLYRLITRGEKQSAAKIECSHCGRHTSASRASCDWCGRRTNPEVAAELADLRAFRRQLLRFRDAKTFDPKLIETMLSGTVRYQQALVQPEAARTAAAKPAEAAPARAETPAPAAAKPGMLPPKPVVAAPKPQTAPAAPPIPPAPPAPRRFVPPKPAVVPVAAVAVPPKPVAPPKPAAPVPPAPPRKTWLESLTELFEERNIPLAEPIGLLVGSLLIVGSSIALVIRFREELEKVFYLRFGIFVAAASAFFGVGLYVYHRWKLRATGFTLLAIATLLVPLVLLAITAMSGGAWSMSALASEVVSLGIFAYLVSLAARVLVPRGVWLQTLAVVGNAAVIVLLSPLLGDRAEAWRMTTIGFLPVAIFASALTPYLWRIMPAVGERSASPESMESSAIVSLFTLLGTATFSLAIALGQLIALSAAGGEIAIVLRHIAPLFALAAVPVLSAGLAVVRGTAKASLPGQPADAKSDSLAAYRTAGTAIALLAMVVMVAALAFAWPHPPGVLAVAALDATALAYVAFRHRLPVLHAGAMVCLAVVYLLGFQLTTGLSWSDASGADILQRAIGVESSASLVGLFLILVAVGEGLARFGYREHGGQYAGGAIVAAVAGLSLVTRAAWFDENGSAWYPMLVYSVYGLGSLGIAARWRRCEIAYLGLGLMVGASLWGLWWQTGQMTPAWGTIAAIESLLFVLISAALAAIDGQGWQTAWNEPRKAAGQDATSPWSALAEVYRLPLAHVGEALAALSLAFASVAAWRGGIGEESILYPMSAACLVAVFLMTAWGYRSPERTWIASAMLLLGMLDTTVRNYPGLVEWPYTMAFLVHATVGIAVAAVLNALANPGRKKIVPPELANVFLQPILQSALITSTAGLLLLANFYDRSPLWLGECLLWLAAIWLAAGWMQRSALLWSAAQAVLTGAAVSLTVAWLQHHPWTEDGSVDLLEVRSLQVYGIALGLLTLFWTVLRVALRRSAAARQLLEPDWPNVDWLVGHAVIVLQFLVVAWCASCTGLAELRRSAVQYALVYADVFGPSAWLLVGVLGAMLIVALWHRWGKMEVVGAMLVAATVPYLLAAGQASQLATASGLRWGLAAASLVGAGVFSARRTVRIGCRRIGARVRVNRLGPLAAQAVLLATTVAPVLGLTVLASLFRLDGIHPGGPVGGFFARFSPSVSYLIPMIAITATLVGLALRESSARYAFSAGLVVQLIVFLAYLLRFSGPRLEAAEGAMIVQLATVTAALWALAWLVARNWVNVWRETPTRNTSTRLMRLQLGMGQLGSAVLLVPALVLLVAAPDDTSSWTIAAGSVWGWLALGLAIAAGAYRQIQLRRPLRSEIAGLAGMAALGLLACTVCGIATEDAAAWGYRTLMLGWAAYALLVALATWWIAGAQTLPGAKGPPQVLIRAASGWVTVAGLAAVLLGLKAAILHDVPHDILWGAAAIAVASTAGATMAVWRRQEGWAFAAAPGVNLAASLVVWYFQWRWRGPVSLELWWVLLVQANIIASAAVALVWLAARKHLYRLHALTIRSSPLLAVQCALGVSALGVILIPAVAQLAWAPWSHPDWIAQLASPPGWIALSLAFAAAGWYLLETSPRELVHVFAALALAIGVLGAGSIESINERLPLAWLSYHVLMVSWAAAAMVVLAAGYVGRGLRIGGPASPEQPESPSIDHPLFPTPQVLAWVTLIGGLTLGLALCHTGADPTGPWWSAGTILGLSLTAGLAAIGFRKAVYVDLSGVLINVAGIVLWWCYCDHNLFSLMETIILCLAIGAGLWAIVQYLHRASESVFKIGERRETYARIAALLSVVLVVGLVAASMAMSATGAGHPHPDRLAWLSLAASAIATVILLWDRGPSFVLPMLYLLALAAVGMALDARELTRLMLVWTAAPEVSAFTLLAALSGWLLVKTQRAWRTLRIPPTDERLPENWFSMLQAIVVGFAATLACWIAMSPRFDGMTHSLLDWPAGRMAGPVAALLLLATAVVTAHLSQGRWRAGWQHAALGLGLLLVSSLGWSRLDPGETSIVWIHRSAILMVSSVLVTLVAGIALPAIVRGESGWSAAGRRSTPILAGLALAMLVAVLGQEASYYLAYCERFQAVPIDGWAKVAVLTALGGLIVACLTMAVVPRLDPLRLSERGRTAYVYLAEFLVLAIILHFRWTMPDLFRLEIMRKYWMLVAMGVAFLGAGLAELFQRRRMPVLSEPFARTAMLLPLAPALGFFFVPSEVTGQGSLAGASPAVWFLGMIFYGVLAATQRKTRYAVAAVLAGNIGLWVLWHRMELGFLERPQLWLIPVALCILVAEYLNHDRLQPAQSSGLRYLALCMIFIPSSAEYLRAIGEEIFPPLILIFLSLLGILVGVVLRIRSFLYMGVTFLLLVIVTMIKYAYSLDQTWVLWTCCILLGAAIIATVGFYEKRREHVLAAVKQFRAWQR